MAAVAGTNGLTAARMRAGSAAGSTGRRLRSSSVHEPRKEAKPQDNGLSVQAKWARILVPLRNNPGVRVPRLSMASDYHPDYAVHIRRFSAFTSRHTPDTKAKKGRVEYSYNVIGEAKSQLTSGSTDAKVSAEISDLAASADELHVCAFLLWDAPDERSQHVAVWRKQAELDMVAFVTNAELESAKSYKGCWQILAGRLGRVGRARQEVYAHFDPVTGQFDLEAFESTAMYATVQQAQRFLHRRAERAFKSA